MKTVREELFDRLVPEEVVIKDLVDTLFTALSSPQYVLLEGL